MGEKITLHERYPSVRDKLIVGFELAKLSGKLAILKLLRADDEVRMEAIGNKTTRNLIDKNAGTLDQQRYLASKLPETRIANSFVDSLYRQ